MEFKGAPEKAFSPAAGDRGGGLMTTKNSKAHHLGWERSSVNQSQAPPSMGQTINPLPLPDRRFLGKNFVESSLQAPASAADRQLGAGLNEPQLSFRMDSADDINHLDTSRNIYISDKAGGGGLPKIGK
jgi:hypothetical protein